LFGIDMTEKLQLGKGMLLQDKPIGCCCITPWVGVCTFARHLLSAPQMGNMTVQTRLAKSVLNLSRANKRGIALTVDALLCIATVAIAYFLRLDRWVVPVGTQWLSYVGALALAIPLFITFGLYRAIFRHAGWGALTAVLRACAVYGAAYALIFSVVGISGIPRTVGIAQPLLLFLAIGASRTLTHYWLGGGYLAALKQGAQRRILIYGAGSAGRQLAAGLANSDEMHVVGFVDDDVTLQGSVLNGKKIYAPAKLDKLIEKLDVADLLLAIPSASRSRRNEILELVRPTSATIRTLPGLADLAHGRVTVNDLRELDIEDLLGRDAVAPNQLLLAKNIAGKVVMITGAGGSIGSELCRQALQLRPSTLLLVEQSEFNLYTIHQELEKLADNIDLDGVELVPLLASVQDEARIESILGTWKPETVYHAAAYKHVPLVEFNPAEGVRNNVFGTLNMALLSKKHLVRDFVLISTDKAVRPTNIMGATKRVAEQILQALAAEGGATRFSMVRFGNVLGSSGSVVPLFRRQIKAGGPITITHAEITRYFMTIPEAAQLVIQAGAMAHGGEVFVLDMGDPVRIIDLAKRMVDLSGLTLRDDENPSGDIEILVVGLRPGEKLYEELLIGDNPEPTGHARIMKAAEGFELWPQLSLQLTNAQKAAANEDSVALTEFLKGLVSGFRARDADVIVEGASRSAA
jgi:FlaA1/EpsC-like NDP-sugar epimerase